MILSAKDYESLLLPKCTNKWTDKTRSGMLGATSKEVDEHVCKFK